MKPILLLIVSLAFAIPAVAQTTNAPPATVTSTLTVSTAPAAAAAYYRLIYDPTGKKVKALIFSKAITSTPWSIYSCQTYAQAQAYATTNTLTGLPPQRAGQP